MTMLASIALVVAPTMTQLPAWDVSPDPVRQLLSFGLAVDIHRERMAVAVAYGGPMGNNPVHGPGEVVVFDRVSTGWIRNAVISCPDVASSYHASFARRIQVNGNHLAVADPQRTILGTPFAGTLWCYDETSSGWELRQQIHRAPQQGYGAYISMDEDRLAVSSSYVLGQTAFGTREVGAVDIYERVQGRWTLTDTLTPVDLGPRGTTQHFGLNVRLHGDLLIAGTDRSSVYASSIGEVRVFERDGSGWNERQVLNAPWDYARSRYGTSGLALDDEWIMVGDAPIMGSYSVALSRSPRVWIYRRGPLPGSPWTLFQYIEPSHWWVSINQADEFGFSVALSGNRMVVGAPRAENSLGQRSLGQAWVFEFNGTSWVETQRLTTPEVENPGASPQYLGWSVDIDGPYIAVGDSHAPAGNPSVTPVGKAYVYENGLGTPTCVGVPNATGQPALLTARGSDYAHFGYVDFFGSSFPPLSVGLLVAAPLQSFVANPAGSQGNLCLGGTLRRLGHRPADAQGNWSLAYELPAAGSIPPNQPAITPGTTWHFQAWYRQPGTPPTSNFSGALEITFR